MRDPGGAEPKIAKYMRCVGRKAKVKTCETTHLSPLTGAPKQLDTPTAAATTNICPAAASCGGSAGFPSLTTAFAHVLEHVLFISTW